MLKEMFAEIGDGCYIEPPLHTNWGGKHVHFGKNIYGNFNLTLVDDTHIYVGDYTMFGPNVTLATAGHPIEPSLREKGYQYNASIHIGKNCWIGAGAVILPGITISDNAVIMIIECRNAKKCFDKPILSALAKLNLWKFNFAYIHCNGHRQIFFENL